MALGTFAFVYPYERYKKILGRQPDLEPDLEIGTVFGLDSYTERTTFTTDYPDTHILKWEPPEGHKSSWFGDCIRSAFAHAQAEGLRGEDDEINYIDIAYSPDRVGMNFRIHMTIAEFLELVERTLQSFIWNVSGEPEGERDASLEFLGFLSDELTRPDVPDKDIPISFERRRPQGRRARGTGSNASYKPEDDSRRMRDA